MQIKGAVNWTQFGTDTWGRTPIKRNGAHLHSERVRSIPCVQQGRHSGSFETPWATFMLPAWPLNLYSGVRVRGDENPARASEREKPSYSLRVAGWGFATFVMGFCQNNSESLKLQLCDQAASVVRDANAFQPLSSPAHVPHYFGDAGDETFASDC